MASFDEKLPRISSTSDSEHRRAYEEIIRHYMRDGSDSSEGKSVTLTKKYTSLPTQHGESKEMSASEVRPSTAPKVETQHVSNEPGQYAASSACCSANQPSAKSSKSSEMRREALKLSKILELQNLQYQVDMISERLLFLEIPDVPNSTGEIVTLHESTENLKTRLSTRLSVMLNENEEKKKLVTREIGTQTTDADAPKICECGLTAQECCKERMDNEKTLNTLYKKYPQLNKELDEWLNMMLPNQDTDDELQLLEHILDNDLLKVIKEQQQKKDQNIEGLKKTIEDQLQQLEGRLLTETDIKELLKEQQRQAAKETKVLTENDVIELVKEQQRQAAQEKKMLIIKDMKKLCKEQEKPTENMLKEQEKQTPRKTKLLTKKPVKVVVKEEKQQPQQPQQPQQQAIQETKVRKFFKQQEKETEKMSKEQQKQTPRKTKMLTKKHVKVVLREQQQQEETNALPEKDIKNSLAQQEKMEEKPTCSKDAVKKIANENKLKLLKEQQVEKKLLAEQHVEKELKQQQQELFRMPRHTNMGRATKTLDELLQEKQQQTLEETKLLTEQDVKIWLKQQQQLDDKPTCSKDAAKKIMLEKMQAMMQLVLRETGGNDEETDMENKGAKRRRSRPKKRNEHKQLNANKKVNNMQQEIAKYVNSIVAEYLGGTQAQVAAKLLFKEGDSLKTFAAELVEAGLGRIVTESIRINRKNNNQAFLGLNSDRETLQADAIIPLRAARMYAFEGDTVSAFVLFAKRRVSESQKQQQQQAENCDVAVQSLKLKMDALQLDAQCSVLDTTEECLENELLAAELEPVEHCPKAFVLEIVKNVPAREIIGYLRLEKQKYLKHVDNYFLRHKPFDRRFPFIYIPAEQQFTLPPQPRKDMEYVYGVIVMQIDDFGYHLGKLTNFVGESGDMRVEVNAILQHNGLSHIKRYEPEMNRKIARNLKPAVQQDGRLNLTKKCIFTIDPATARDLDDAVSIELATEGIYEVGVHISDVAFYLKENSDLDNIVKERCTSIYLVNEVIHMLPEVLCQHCSLLPNENKYTFSVFWHITEKGEILGQPRFTRSLIRSCAQLAYEHAQAIIDLPRGRLSGVEFPAIHNGYNLADIRERILNLHKIAQILRANRYEAGALSIDNPKLRFTLCEETLEPLGYELESRQSANFLIEEYMLLANQAVASFIYKRYPDVAILRSHDPPLKKSMRNLAERLSHYGINIDYSSAKALQRSMLHVCKQAENPIAMNTLLSAVLMKPMARAK